MFLNVFYRYPRRKQTMETEKQNREVVGKVGDLVENLFNEVTPLPISDAAKNAMVMVMTANCIRGVGGDYFVFAPPKPT
jgi:hypothetical protein